MEKYDEEMDQNASQILNYLYDFDVETSKTTFDPFEGAGYTQSEFLAGVMNIKIKENKQTR